jgi:uncharacterized membrane protein
MTQHNTGVPDASRSRRIDYIDLVRGWAVIVMIETHVFNATLAPAWKETDPFAWMKFMNGLVAPSFLFASGLAYAVTTRRKLSEYLSFGTPLFKHTGRLLFIMALGYLLHLPKFNYTNLVYWTEERYWRIFFQADVLQCIAVSLLFMQVLLLVVRTERRVYGTIAAMAVAIVFLTPVVWGIDFWPLLPPFLAGYTNGMHFTNFPGFPVFPWTAFLFAGAVFGYAYLRARDGAAPGQAGHETTMMKRSLWWAAGLIVVSFLLDPVAASVYPTYDYWKFSPSFFLLRLGIVIVFCVGMFSYEKHRSVSPRSPITLIGRESLIVYATHLLLIYGDIGAFNFAKRVNHTFGFGEALLVTVLLMLAMYGLALFWNTIKRNSPRWKIALQVGTLAVLLVVFFCGWSG